MRPVTLRDVAEKAGVSVMTVSLALRGEGRMTVETRGLITTLANQLGYRPNAFARAVRAPRFETIGLITDPLDPNSPLSHGLLSGINAELAQHDRHVLFASLPDRVLSDGTRIPKLLRELRVDALLLNYHTRDPEGMPELLERHRIPAVWINRKRSTDAVWWDDLAAARAMTRRVINAGHTRIAYVDASLRLQHAQPGDRHYSKDERLDGYESTLRKAGLTPYFLTDRLEDGCAGLPWQEWFPRQLAAWKSAGQMPTAFVSYSMGILQFIASTLMQLRCRDASRVMYGSFSDVWWDHLYLPQPCSPMLYVQKPWVLGQRAVQMLMRRIETNQPQLGEAVPFELDLGSYAADQA